MSNKKEKTIKLIISLLLLGVLVGMLCFVSFKFALTISGLMIVFFGVLIIAAKKKPLMVKYVIAAYALIMIALNSSYNFRNLPVLLPLYQPKTQTQYIKEFYNPQEESLYPDSLIQLLIKEREVLVQNRGNDYYEDPYWYWVDEEDGKLKNSRIEDPNYYHGRDYARYFDAFAKTVTVNEKLITGDDLSPAQVKENFTCIGMGNDMLKYVFPLNNDEHEYYASSFMYAWIYKYKKELFSIYLNPDKIEDSEKVVALWDEKDNLYIMSYEYYKEEIAP